MSHILSEVPLNVGTSTGKCPYLAGSSPATTATIIPAILAEKQNHRSKPALRGQRKGKNPIHFPRYPRESPVGREPCLQMTGA